MWRGQKQQVGVETAVKIPQKPPKNRPKKEASGTAR